MKEQELIKKLAKQYKEELNCIGESMNRSTVIRDLESLLNSEKEIYWKPKTDKDRVFNFISCEVKFDEGGWLPASLVCIDEEDEYKHFAKPVGHTYDWFEHCRIKPFDIDNPPPVDTLVNIGTESTPDIRHFKAYENKECIHYFKNGSSKTGSAYMASHDFSFIDFPESQFEIMGE